MSYAGAGQSGALPSAFSPAHAGSAGATSDSLASQLRPRGVGSFHAGSYSAAPGHNTHHDSAGDHDASFMRSSLPLSVAASGARIGSSSSLDARAMLTGSTDAVLAAATAALGSIRSPAQPGPVARTGAGSRPILTAVASPSGPSTQSHAVVTPGSAGKSGLHRTGSSPADSSVHQLLAASPSYISSSVGPAAAISPGLGSPDGILAAVAARGSGYYPSGRVSHATPGPGALALGSSAPLAGAGASPDSAGGAGASGAVGGVYPSPQHSSHLSTSSSFRASHGAPAASAVVSPRGSDVAHALFTSPASSRVSAAALASPGPAASAHTAVGQRRPPLGTSSPGTYTSAAPALAPVLSSGGSQTGSDASAQRGSAAPSPSPSGLSAVPSRVSTNAAFVGDGASYARHGIGVSTFSSSTSSSSAAAPAPAAGYPRLGSALASVADVSDSDMDTSGPRPAPAPGPAAAPVTHTAFSSPPPGAVARAGQRDQHAGAASADRGRAAAAYPTASPPSASAGTAGAAAALASRSVPRPPSQTQYYGGSSSTSQSSSLAAGGLGIRPSYEAGRARDHLSEGGAASTGRGAVGAAFTDPRHGGASGSSASVTAFGVSTGYSASAAPAGSAAASLSRDLFPGVHTSAVDPRRPSLNSAGTGGGAGGLGFAAGSGVGLAARLRPAAPRRTVAASLGGGSYRGNSPSDQFDSPPRSEDGLPASQAGSGSGRAGYYPSGDIDGDVDAADAEDQQHAAGGPGASRDSSGAELRALRLQGSADRASLGGSLGLADAGGAAPLGDEQFPPLASSRGAGAVGASGDVAAGAAGSTASKGEGRSPSMPLRSASTPTLLDQSFMAGYSATQHSRPSSRNGRPSGGRGAAGGAGLAAVDRTGAGAAGAAAPAIIAESEQEQLFEEAAWAAASSAAAARAAAEAETDAEAVDSARGARPIAREGRWLTAAPGYAAAAAAAATSSDAASTSSSASSGGRAAHHSQDSPTGAGRGGAASVRSAATTAASPAASAAGSALVPFSSPEHPHHLSSASRAQLAGAAASADRAASKPAGAGAGAALSSSSSATSSRTRLHGLADDKDILPLFGGGGGDDVGDGNRGSGGGYGQGGASSPLPPFGKPPSGGGLFADLAGAYPSVSANPFALHALLPGSEGALAASLENDLYHERRVKLAAQGEAAVHQFESQQRQDLLDMATREAAALRASLATASDGLREATTQRDALAAALRAHMGAVRDGFGDWTRLRSHEAIFAAADSRVPEVLQELTSLTPQRVRDTLTGLATHTLHAVTELARLRDRAAEVEDRDNVTTQFHVWKSASQTAQIRHLYKCRSWRLPRVIA